MTSLAALWLPILLSAMFVFLASSLIHMFTPWHKGDYRRMDAQDRVMDALRPIGIPPGDYMVPCPERRADLKSPEYLEKVAKGPVMVVTVLPNGMMNIGKNMLYWFIYLVVVAIFAAYIAGRALAPGADYLKVFQFAGAAAFIGYSLALWQLSIWYRRAWSTTLKSTVDGLLYACLTAGTMGWLWPK